MRPHKVTLPRILLMVALLAIPPLAGGSRITDYAFAPRDIAHVRGIRANIWTAQQPGGWYAIAGIVSVCTTTTFCTGRHFETGYVKGTITAPRTNVLQQFAAWVDPDGTSRNVYDLGDLNDNAWYEFKSLYSTTAQRWEAWRGNDVVYFLPYPLTYTEGSMTLCGAEGGGLGVSLGVECNNMRYKSGSAAWTQYNYQLPLQITPGYCVYKPYEYGAIGWGPNAPCN